MKRFRAGIGGRMLRRRRSLLAGVCLLISSLVLLTFFPGCQVGYLRRQAIGALTVYWGRVKIDSNLLARLSPEERKKLEWVGRVREFAANELGLEPGNAYTTYYDTGGAPISYIVAAAHPLALEPYTWRFPIVGRVPYLGHFNVEEARAERDRLAREGYDTTCLPVQAFSTLGWFSDPVLSTMLNLPEGELAELLIHEMTHRTIYFRDHTDLNEGLATLTGREGAERLLEAAFGKESPELLRFRESRALDEIRDEVLERLGSDLDSLYHSELSDAYKLERKDELFATAQAALRAAGAASRLEHSNAYLVLNRHYSDLVPFLRAAQKVLGGHPRELVKALKDVRGAIDPAATLGARLSALSAAYSPSGKGAPALAQ